MVIKRTEKKATHRTQPNSDRLQRYGLPAFLNIIAAVLCAVAVSGQPAVAADDLDQLRVTGVIKGVNTGTGLVSVDVTSSSCNGMRVFKADKIEKLGAYVGQRVSFFINGDRCNATEVYTILVDRGLRK
jgi:hypothetical protein